MSQKDAQWLRCGTVLKVFLAFRLEVKALGNPKGKVVLEFWSEMLFLGLAFLRVIGHYLNEINIKFKSIEINQPTRCNNFSSLLPDFYVQLNMFRASSRPSSGAQQLQ